MDTPIHGTKGGFMKKILLLVFLLFFAISCSAAEQDFIGLWYYYHNGLEQDIFMSITEIDGVIFVIQTAAQRPISSLMVGEVNENIIRFTGHNLGVQEYTYIKESDTLFRSYTTNTGQSGEITYQRVTREKATSIFGLYFN